MKRILKSFILSLVLIFCLSACRERIILTEQDELTMSNWVYTSEYGMSALLKFDDAKAKFTVYQDDKVTVNIFGYYKLDEKSIIIMDDKLVYDIVFEYKLMGDTIELTYDKNSITMNRSK